MRIILWSLQLPRLWTGLPKKLTQPQSTLLHIRCWLKLSVLHLKYSDPIMSLSMQYVHTVLSLRGLYWFPNVYIFLKQKLVIFTQHSFLPDIGLRFSGIEPPCLFCISGYVARRWFVIRVLLFVFILRPTQYVFTHIRWLWTA